jgi:hypothetical protein
MVRSLALGVAVLALMTVAVSAHGPTRQKVTETVEINAPPEKGWETIGNFQGMSWHPAVEKVEGTGANEANATRILTLTGGGTIAEKLIQYERSGSARSASQSKRAGRGPSRRTSAATT